MIQSSPETGAAIDAPLDGGLVAIVGDAGTGKTTALLQRLAGAVSAGALDVRRALLVSPSPFAAARLRALAASSEYGALEGPWLGVTLDRLAVHLVAQHALRAGAALDVREISDAEALAAFQRAGASLFAMEWIEFVSDEIDPELAGLRTPERFAAAALRLIRKLRAAGISPEDFQTKALRGSVAFYAKLPNFANPDLLIGTREEYRDSLAVTPAELERQRRHEVDLAKVIARLYRSYLEELVAAGHLTRGDAIAEATRLLGAYPDVAASARATVDAAFVDDAQDLGTGDVRLLAALFGERLARVTFAGDAAQSTRVFAGARPERTFSLASQTFALAINHRGPAAIANAARLVVDPRLTQVPSPRQRAATAGAFAPGAATEQRGATHGRRHRHLDR